MSGMYYGKPKGYGKKGGYDKFDDFDGHDDFEKFDFYHKKHKKPGKCYCYKELDWDDCCCDDRCCHDKCCYDDCCPDKHYHFHKWEKEKKKPDHDGGHDKKEKKTSYLAATGTTPTGIVVPGEGLLLEFNASTVFGGNEITKVGSSNFNLEGEDTYLVQVTTSFNTPSTVLIPDPLGPVLQIRSTNGNIIASVPMLGTDINSAPGTASEDLFTATLYTYITVPKHSNQTIQAIVRGVPGINITNVSSTINILEVI